MSPGCHLLQEIPSCHPQQSFPEILSKPKACYRGSSEGLSTGLLIWSEKEAQFDSVLQGPFGKLSRPRVYFIEDNLHWSSVSPLFILITSNFYIDDMFSYQCFPSCGAKTDPVFFPPLLLSCYLLLFPVPFSSPDQQCLGGVEWEERGSHISASSMALAAVPGAHSPSPLLPVSTLWCLPALGGCEPWAAVSQLYAAYSLAPLSLLHGPVHLL